MWTVTLLALLLGHKEGEGRLLNLGGSLDISYGYLRSDEGGDIFKTTSLQQRYSLRNYGELVDKRIGSYTLGFTFLKQDVRTTTFSSDRDYKLQDYSLSANLMPYVAPLSLYAQQVVNEQVNGLILKSRLNTFGANWSLSLPKYPRLGISLNRSELNSGDRMRLPDTISDYLNVDTSSEIGNTSWTARYQFNSSEVARGNGVVDSFSSNSVNLTTRSQLTPGVVLATFARYASKGGSSATGLGFIPERGLGASLFWSPNLVFDTNVRYEISVIPDTTKTQRQMAFANFNIHPTRKLDILTGIRFLSHITGPVRTEAPYGNLNVSWRPFFGLTTGVGASAGYTSVAGGPKVVRSYFHRYRFYTNYTKTRTLIRYTSSYSLSYGINKVNQGVSNTSQDNAKDLINTVTVSLENTRIRIVHVAAIVTFNDIRRTVTTVQSEEDQRSMLYQISADSNYFRNLLAVGDSLQLVGTTSLTQINGFGVNGNTWLIDGYASYYYRWIIARAGYTRQDYAHGTYNDTDLVYEEIQWSRNVANLTILISLRDSHQFGRGDPSIFTRDSQAGSTVLSWQIGQFIAGIDYRISNDKTDGVRFVNQSFYGRVSRYF